MFVVDCARAAVPDRANAADPAAMPFTTSRLDTNEREINNPPLSLIIVFLPLDDIG